MILVEKYRPKKLEDLVVSESFQPVLNKIIETGDIPNMILYGHTGTGKSSIINVIRNQLDVDYDYINASERETRGIGVVDEIIKPFCQRVAFSKRKVFDIREADQLTPDAQKSLKDVIEENSDDTTFIMSVNNINKIIPELKGRCKPYKIVPDDPKKVAIHISKICKAEQISISKPQIIEIVKTYFPDIRSMVMDIDHNMFDGKYTQNTVKGFEQKYDAIIDLIKSCKNKKDVIVIYNKVRAIVNDMSDNEIDASFAYLFDHVNEITSDDMNYILFNFKISEYMFKNSTVVDKQVNLATLLLNIIEQPYYGISESQS